MTAILEELPPGEIGKLSIYLREGLGDESSSFSNKDVLEWKYLGRTDEDRTVSFVAKDDNGDICGHVGATYARFMLPGSTKTHRGMFPTDWLSSAPGAGIKLAKLALTDSPVLYALGGTNNAERALRGMRCRKMEDVSVMRRFLSVGEAMANAVAGDGNLIRKAARAARDARQALIPLRNNLKNLQLEPVNDFAEVDMERFAAKDFVRTVRTPERMNHLLTHPRKHLSGWTVREGAIVRGYALLRAEEGSCGLGKIVDCQMESMDPDVWTDVFTLLLHKLRELGAGIVLAHTSIPLWRNALRKNGFHDYGSCFLMIRASDIPIPSTGYMFTSLEGDHGYF